ILATHACALASSLPLSRFASCASDRFDGSLDRQSCRRLCSAGKIPPDQLQAPPTRRSIASQAGLCIAACTCSYVASGKATNARSSKPVIWVQFPAEVPVINATASDLLVSRGDMRLIRTTRILDALRLHHLAALAEECKDDVQHSRYTLPQDK